MTQERKELIELASLVSDMRCAQKEYRRLKYSIHPVARAAVRERMLVLQKEVDAELRKILEIDDVEDLVLRIKA